MNNTIYYDAQLSDDERRKLIFEGQLIAYSPRKHSLALVEHARELIEERRSHPTIQRRLNSTCRLSDTLKCWEN